MAQQNSGNNLIFQVTETAMQSDTYARTVNIHREIEGVSTATFGSKNEGTPI